MVGRVDQNEDNLNSAYDAVTYDAVSKKHTSISASFTVRLGVSGLNLTLSAMKSNYLFP